MEQRNRTRRNTTELRSAISQKVPILTHFPNKPPHSSKICSLSLFQNDTKEQSFDWLFGFWDIGERYQPLTPRPRSPRGWHIPTYPVGLLVYIIWLTALIMSADGVQIAL